MCPFSIPLDGNPAYFVSTTGDFRDTECFSNFDILEFEYKVPLDAFGPLYYPKSEI